MHISVSARGVVLALATSTMACGPESDDEPRPEARDVSTQGAVVGCCGAGDSGPGVNGLRLALSSAPPNAINDWENQSITLTPYTSNRLALFDGSAWIVRSVESSAFAQPPGTPNAIYDVFSYWAGTHVALELIPWPTSSGGVPLEWRDGVPVKGSDATSRYLGVVGTGSNGNIQDKRAQRLIWNKYNQVPRTIEITPSGYWNYTNPNSVWRSSANNAFGSVTVLVGETAPQPLSPNGGSFLSAQSDVMGHPTATICCGWVASGIGIDSSTVNSAQVTGLVRGTTADWAHATAFYEGYLTRGRHTIQWLETGWGNVNYSFLGTPGDPTFGKTGLIGWVMM